jgi:Domain of unknown function (DUF4184)
MSFTISHVAVVLPFVRRRIAGLSDVARRGISAGLVIGSMAPDFEKFAPVRRAYFLEVAHLHRPHTMVKYGIPICFLIAAIVEILAPTIGRIIGFRPAQDQMKVFPRSLVAGLLFAAGVIVGSFSHIAIDRVTHTDNYFVYRSRYLMKPIDLGFVHKPLATVLWWATSFLGLFIVAIWLFVRRNNVARTEPNYDVLALICGSSLFVGSIFGYRKSSEFGRYTVLKYTFLGFVATATLWIVAFTSWERIRRIKQEG